MLLSLFGPTCEELNAHGKLKRQKGCKKYLTPVSTELDSDFLARWTLMAPGSTFECITSRSRPPVSRCTLDSGQMHYGFSTRSWCQQRLASENVKVLMSLFLSTNTLSLFIKHPKVFRSKDTSV